MVTQTIAQSYAEDCARLVTLLSSRRPFSLLCAMQTFALASTQTRNAVIPPPNVYALAPLPSAQETG
jgi:hypothetical protein